MAPKIQSSLINKSVYIVLLIPFFLTGYARLNHTELFEKLFTDNRLVSDATSLQSIRGAGRHTASNGFPQAGEKTYLVKRNDSWYKIAKEFGVPDYKKLRDYNDNRKLIKGMQIKIPLRMINR